MCAKSTAKTQTEKKEFNLEQVCTLWIYKGKKSGKTFLSGVIKRGEESEKVIGLFNKEKQNPKQPDISIYVKDENGKKGDLLCSLWVNANGNGKKYASGKLDEKRVVGFFNSKASVDGVIPYLNVYFSDDEQKVEDEKPEKDEKPKKKEPEYEEVEIEELPF